MVLNRSGWTEVGGYPSRRLAYKLCASRPHTSGNGCTLGTSSMPALVSVPPSGAVAVSAAVDNAREEQAPPATSPDGACSQTREE